MKITDFLCPTAVTADLKAADKKGVIEELIDLMIAQGAVPKKHKMKIIEALTAREALGSTAIGQGVAIPHAKSECVSKLVGCVGISKAGVDFDSLDGDPAHIFFLLVAPMDSAGPHLKALARIAKLLKDKYFRENLRTSKDEKTILKLISVEDKRTA